MTTATRVDLSLRERNAAIASGGDTIGRQSDDALVLSARHEPNGRSFQELLIRYCAWVRRIVQRLLGKQRWTWDAIEDAQSDAIFALFRAIERFNPNPPLGQRPCSFRPFLTRLVVHRFIDFARKHERYRQRNCISLDSGHAADHDSACACRACCQVTEAVASDQSNPAVLAEQNERKARLYEAIRKLKPIYRRVAELDAAGQSFDEIAAELQLKPECAKKRRTKARAELKRLLTEGDSDAMTGEK